MAEVHVKGCRIWYETTGSGPYLLQIGGSGFAHENFSPVVGFMREHFTVIDFDLRGYGNSDRPEQKYDLDVWVDDIVAVLDDIGVTRTHVHGSSMGGLVAIRLAARHPERIDRLILSCTLAKADYAVRARMEVWKVLAQAGGMGGEALALDTASMALSRAFLDTPAGEETVRNIQRVLARNCSVPVYSQACDIIRDADLRDLLPRIQAQTLVIDGDEDILTPLDQAPSGFGNRAIAQALPNGRLHVMKGVAHTNMMERPEESARLMVEFLQS